MLRSTLLAASAASILALGTSQAFAWGHTGHLLISQLGMLNLPREVPAFLRTAAAARQVSELGAEADVLKSAGDAGRPNSDVSDFEHGSAHYIDLDENQFVLSLSGVPLSSLLVPNQSRRDFDTAMRAASSNRNTQYDGYLPFQMTDGWQQIRKDFAYYRAYAAAIANPNTAAADRTVFQYQLQLRQQLILRDIGYWSHFVADASQPMHVSIHFNGWGNYPNPNGYTTRPIHAPFEGPFVKNFISADRVEAQMGTYVPCACDGIEARVRAYLVSTLATVDQTYILEKTAGSNGYATNDPSENAFITKRLAAGATELRDEIVDAWRSSATIVVGFPLIKVSDIESGIVILTPDKLASD